MWIRWHTAFEYRLKLCNIIFEPSITIDIFMYIYIYIFILFFHVALYFPFYFTMDVHPFSPSRTCCVSLQVRSGTHGRCYATCLYLSHAKHGRCYSTFLYPRQTRTWSMLRNVSLSFPCKTWWIATSACPCQKHTWSMLRNVSISVPNAHMVDATQILQIVSLPRHCRVCAPGYMRWMLRNAFFALMRVPALAVSHTT